MDEKDHKNSRLLSRLRHSSREERPVLGGHEKISGETRAGDSPDHRSEAVKDAEPARSLRVAEKVKAASAN